ncbi:helix-turn-helix domain-containing protein [Streptomyces sp. NPDC050095]|uniref:helix-turn-helix domain-containing protein n=1 Tax=unclassified Streptomyces TaxID=2593676 RepID=UPI0034230326
MTKRLKGTERTEAAARLRTAYDGGYSIRQCTVMSGLSYGCTRRLLIEAGTRLRTSGPVRRNTTQPVALAIPAQRTYGD